MRVSLVWGNDRPPGHGQPTCGLPDRGQQDRGAAGRAGGVQRRVAGSAPEHNRGSIFDPLPHWLTHLPQRRCHTSCQRSMRLKLRLDESGPNTDLLACSAEHGVPVKCAIPPPSPFHHPFPHSNLQPSRHPHPPTHQSRPSGTTGPAGPDAVFRCAYISVWLAHAAICNTSNSTTSHPAVAVCGGVRGARRVSLSRWCKL